MEKTRPILYGVADYAQIRKKNAWFVDRTAKIRDLENIAYAVFLRPRRFGKSLLTSILEAYYDVACADRFDELFAGTDIGAVPTEERNRYLVLYFNFSAVSKDVRQVGYSFEKYAENRFDAFAEKYAQIIPEGLSEKILSSSSAEDKMNALFSGMKGAEPGIYCIIDEYDNFTNTILAESGEKAYNELCHGDGFFKQFFTGLKTLTTSLDAPLKRLFITGVSPVTMDDVTSGFNIGTNISLWPQFADLTGFRHDDIRAMAQYYAAAGEFDAATAEQVCLGWFDNYRFGAADAPPIANTTLVLNFFNLIVNGKTWPHDYIDKNLRTDYAKIRHLLTVDRRLNGNFHAIETIVSEGSVTEQLIDSFQAKDIAKRENFVSLLYWLGITTIVGDDMGTPVFGLPNAALRQIAAQMFTEAYSDACGIDQRIPAVNAGLRAFAAKGTWDALLEPLLDVVKQNFAVRDAKEGETAVASAVSAILISAGGPYVVKREREANGGFYDLSMSPRFDIAPNIAHAALIELKYVKAGDPAPTPEQREKIKKQAIDQLDQYSADPVLAAEWHIGGRGATALPRAATSAALPTVTLHRLVLVFHGGDCVLNEEV